MLLRAFSSGAVALSGVEAVSNGVPAFRKPEARNASMTLAMMAGILGVCFLGVSVLASEINPYRGEDDPTVIALDGRAHLRRQGRAVLDHPARHVRHLDPRRQHRIPGLPGTVVDHRPRRLPAAPARQSWRQARLLQRHHLPRHRRRRPDRHLQGQHLGSDPALRVRRVHGLHTEPGGHGGAPPARARTPLAGVAGDQRLRLRGDGDRRDRSSSCPSSPRAPGSRPSSSPAW